MNPSRRWYDQEIACHRLLDQIKDIPQPESREFCARVLIHFIDKLRKKLRKDKEKMGLSSIGVPAISSLYGFGRYKRRWYDKEPACQKAMGLLYTMPEEGLTALAFILGDTIGLIQVYSTVCHEVDQPPDMKELAEICVTALQSGREEAEELLIAIVGKDLYESLRPSQHP